MPRHLVARSADDPGTIRDTGDWSFGLPRTAVATRFALFRYREQDEKVCDPATEPPGRIMPFALELTCTS